MSKRRFINSIIGTAQTPCPAMPYARGARRAAWLRKRRFAMVAANKVSAPHLRRA